MIGCSSDLPKYRNLNKIDNADLYTLQHAPLPRANQWGAPRMQWNEWKGWSVSILRICIHLIRNPVEEGQIRTNDRGVSIRGWNLNCRWVVSVSPTFALRSPLHPNQFHFELEPSFIRRLDGWTNNRNNRFNLRILLRARQQTLMVYS